MQVRRNGIAIQTPKRKRKREPLTHELGKRKFRKYFEGVEVVVVVPHFSPIVEVMREDNWREK